MKRFNRDTLVAIFLLLFCGTFLVASLNIRETSYDTLGSEVWPQIILVFLFVLSLCYLTVSLRQPGDEEREGPRGLKAWLSTYRNALWCYVLFALFLVALPYLGMLLAGVLFVFATLTALGRRDMRAHAVHAAVAIVSVGGMWSLFTFGLRVMLPEGVLFTVW